jgi:hypothetical protein
MPKTHKTTLKSIKNPLIHNPKKIVSTAEPNPIANSQTVCFKCLIRQTLKHVINFLTQMFKTKNMKRNWTMARIIDSNLRIRMVLSFTAGSVGFLMLLQSGYTNLEKTSI